MGIGIAIWAICAVLWWETTRFPKVAAALSQNISAAFFPRLLIVTVAILAAVMVWNGWRASPERRSLPGARTLLTAAATIVGVLLIPVLGVLPVVLLIAAALPLLWGERRYGIVALYAVALPAAIYLVFTLVLRLNFPLGIFES